MSMRLFVQSLLLVACAVSCPAVQAADHETLLRDAEKVAAKFRAAEKDGTESDDNHLTKLKGQVEALVKQSFDARQADQREQLSQMREKLRLAEIALDNREKIRDRIVSRKVEDLLSDHPADWKPAEAEGAKQFDVIAIGDTVTIYLEGVLPFNPPNAPPTPPQVNILQSGRIVTGYPFTVGSDGAVMLPLVGGVRIAGLSVREAEATIREVYVHKDILRPEKAFPTVTLIPREEAKFNVAGGVAYRPSSTTVELATSVPASEVAAFQDTYGRISNAGEAVREIKKIRSQLKKSMSLLLPKKYTESQRRDIINVYEEQIDSAKLRLELERDYLNDTIAQLEAEVNGRKALYDQAKQNHSRSGMMFAKGVLSAQELSQAQTQLTREQSELSKAEQKLGQYQKILKRWQDVVGDTLQSDAEE